MDKLRAIALALVLAVFALPTLAVAQTEQYGQPIDHWTFAADYGVTILVGSGNSYSWNAGVTGPGSCQQNPNIGGAPPFFVFGPTAHPFPIFIRDYNPADNEVVTPSSTSLTGSNCGFSASTTYVHNTFWVQSGTGGLYEAIYANQKSPYPVSIFIDALWKSYIAALPGTNTLGTELIGIPAAFGTSNITIVDTTTQPFTYYKWNGSTWNSPGGGTPTPAFGAAAGSAPSGLLATGPGLDVTVSFTSGTSTTTGTIFTLTYPSGTTSNGFNHQPVCTAASVGPTAYTLGTLTYSGSSSAGYVVTAPEVTSALTASTFYSFRVTCN
jgi:hypothetical protein